MELSLKIWTTPEIYMVAAPSYASYVFEKNVLATLPPPPLPPTSPPPPPPSPPAITEIEMVRAADVAEAAAAALPDIEDIGAIIDIDAEENNNRRRNVM